MQSDQDKEALKKEILKLKKDRKAILLAHNYQISEVQEIADFLGDSLELSKISKAAKEEVIVFAGVRFMAETAKILSPKKKVLLPVQEAGCPLAEMIEPEQLIELKQKYPDAWVVSYVNTTAEIKALSDVCCTSSNAVTVVKNVPVKKVIFVPDKNLGWWVQKNVSEKEVITWPGFCFVHEYFSLKDLEETRRIHPEAEVMVHPECIKEVLENADYVVSTAGMLKKAKESKAKKIIVGTEEGMIYRLSKENPNKEFYSLGNAKVCTNMKRTTLSDLRRALIKDEYKVDLSPETIDRAQIALERMVSYV
ncbi:MAG: quinolinate synthase NadA [Candidatus Omnitrophica bacterium]|nr:quinolinate synthase NadA [Candidatus Omnitrophota bacterium]